MEERLPVVEGKVEVSDVRVGILVRHNGNLEDDTTARGKATSAWVGCTGCKDRLP